MSCSVPKPTKLILNNLSPSLRVIPFHYCGVAAGFPSPADDYVESSLNVHQYLVKNEAATFMTRANGNSMQGVGILDKALIIVDRSLNAANGNVVVALINGEYTVKFLRREKQRTWLQAANADFQDIALSEDTGAEIWGVVTAAINEFSGVFQCSR
jgi:DNA polymerase V